MKAQDLIFAVAAPLFLGGFIGILAGGARKGQPSRRPKWAAAGLAMLGAALLWTDASSAYFTSVSAQPVVVGTIANLSQHSGRSASSHFIVAGDTGNSPTLRTDYHGANLVNGERVEVRFLAYDDSALDLKVLSGPNQGWELHEGDDTLSKIFLAIVGLVLCFVGYQTWPKHDPGDPYRIS